jgi:ABC-type phosphate transport system permease subunit
MAHQAPQGKREGKMKNHSKKEITIAIVGALFALVIILFTASLMAQTISEGIEQVDTDKVLNKVGNTLGKIKQGMDEVKDER